MFTQADIVSIHIAPWSCFKVFCSLKLNNANFNNFCVNLFGREPRPNILHMSTKGHFLVVPLSSKSSPAIQAFYPVYSYVNSNYSEQSVLA